MKLALRLVSVVLLGIVALVGIDGYLSVRREVQLFEVDMRRDAVLLGETLRAVVVDTWRTSGEQRARDMIADADRRANPLRVRWVWLDASAGSPDAPAIPADPKTRSEKTSSEWHAVNGRVRLFTYVPVDVSPTRPGALEISESLWSRTRYSRITIERVVVLAIGLVLAGGFTAWFLGVRMIGKPLHRLTDKTRRIGLGDLGGPLSLRGRDELSELAGAINLMCDQLAEARERVQAETAARIRALEQLRHADRLKTVGRLASGVAHELGTPLNVVSGRAQMIATGGLSPEETTDNARIIRAQTDRMTGIIRELLDFARRRPSQREHADLGAVVRESAQLLESLARKCQVTLIATRMAHDATARVDVSQIQQVLTNLIMNAIQAMPSGGQVEIETEISRKRPPATVGSTEGEYVCLRVRDHGQGIAQENLAYIFEPFFTTKDVGDGTGLGLSVAYGIIQEHNGWIDVSSKLDEGSCFSVYVPREPEHCPNES